MKKTLLVYLRGILLAGVLLLSGIGAQANHIAGIDMFYSWVSGTTYRITLVAYGDCGVPTPDLSTSTPQICIYNGNTSVGNVTLNIVAPTAGEEITPVCPASIGSTTCSGGTIPGIKKFTYTGTYTLPSTSQYWRFIFNGSMGASGAGRASSITNITGVTRIQLIDTLDNRFANNSSPRLTNDPTPYFCLNSPNTYSPAGVDADGDSLVYQLVSGKVSSTNCGNITTGSGVVAYETSFQAWPGQPISGTTPLRVATGAFSFFANNGRILFTPNNIQNALVVYNIREYRAGVFIGSSQREMTFLVQACTTTPPDGGLSGATNGAIVDPTSFQICSGSGPFSFHILPTSTDPTLNVKITATGIPVGATFNVINDSTPNPDATFSWTSTSVTPGLYTINVTFKDDQCPINGSNTVPFSITINSLADIAGTPIVCEGATTTLTNTTSGGSWSSSAPAIATVGSGTGVVTGVSGGTATISYSVGTCFKTYVVTVNPMPAAFGGGSSVCIGQTITLTSTPTGAWLSSTPAVGTVGITTGVLGGVSAGTTNITYTLAPTGCQRIQTITVNALPTAITGSLSVCVGATTALASTPTGGTWSEASPNISVVAATGVVTGVAVGTGIVTYSSAASCIRTAVVTVNALPNTINPGTPTILCVGDNVNFFNTTPGGTWTSSNGAVATVGSIGSPTSVSAVSAGTTTISYILTATGCSSTKGVTVNSSPAAITPATASVCAGSTLALGNTVSGGVWSSSNPARASVDATSGVVTGILVGTVNITYAIGSCNTIRIVTVNASPGAITGGSFTVCVGDNTTWLNATPGGVWSSSAAGIATVGTSGLITGVALGTATISYTVSGCSATRVISVGITPAAITPAAPVVCPGSTITLNNTVGGGTWSSSNLVVATVDASGVASGLAAGTTNITYAIGSCFTTVVLTVNTAPVVGVISGPPVICVTATGGYSNPSPGGVWSTTTGNATITAGGIATGVTLGLDTIRYAVTNACGTTEAILAITVNPFSSAGTISGPTSVCVSGLITLSATVPGGVWSSSNSNATVGSTSGVVTGILPGIDTISYTLTSVCGVATSTHIVTINTLPSAGAITGPGSVCVGANITLTSTVPGGTWSVANANATINTTTGVVNGITAGTNTVTYTFSNSCGTATATSVITINPLPDAGTISGPDSVCVGASITLTNASPGGVWSAGNANATVGGSGIVTGVAAGTVPISYTVTNGCGTVSAVKNIVVVAPPTAGVISGPSAVCQGAGITLMSSAPGGVWSSSNANAVISGPGIVTGAIVGTAVISYTVVNLCGVATATHTVSINPVPVVASITGPTSHCVGSSITLSNTTPGGNWTSSNMSVATVGLSTGIVNGLTGGVVNITYTVTNALGCPSSAVAVDTVLDVPALASIAGNATVCIGSGVLLTCATPGGVWSSSAPANVTIDLAGNVTGVAIGTATISYTVTNICGVGSVTRVQTVLPLPTVAPITGVTNQCVGLSTILTSATSGGVWSSSDITVATVDVASGLVTGVSGGVVTITYNFTDAAGCSSFVVAADTVTDLPVVLPIGGITGLCVGTTETLTNGTPSGVWSSTDLSVATIGVTGDVLGVVAGTTIVSYTVTNAAGCVAAATTVVTVFATPTVAPIAGTTAVCAGATTMLSSATPGGTWASSDASVASIDAVGLVTGIIPGTSSITYTVTNICGVASDAVTVTVNAAPSAGVISAAIPTVCSGGNTAMTSTVPGGVWTSGDVTMAIVDATTGLVTAVSVGSVTISYTVTLGGCAAFATYTLAIGPAIPGLAILPVGSASLCNGNPVNMRVSSLTPGLTYQWYANGIAIAGATNSGYITDTVGLYSVVVDNGVCSQLLAGPNVIFMSQPVIGFNPPNLLFTGSYALYQWYRNGLPIAGANSSIVNILGAGSYKVVVEDANGCIDTSAVYYISGGPTNVSTVSSNDISIFPNPATTVINITAPVKIDVLVLAIDGRKVIEQNDVTKLDISRLSSGLYMILVYDENKTLLKAAKFNKVD